MNTAGGVPGSDVADLVLSVFEILEEVISRTGGLPGLRDAQMLHSACTALSPRLATNPCHETPFEQAAALFHSLIKSHPFMDGTKRTALLSALYLLRLAGHQIPTTLPHAVVVAYCVDVAEESLNPSRPRRSIHEIADWLRCLIEVPPVAK